MATETRSKITYESKMTVRSIETGNKSSTTVTSNMSTFTTALTRVTNVTPNYATIVHLGQLLPYQAFTFKRELTYEKTGYYNRQSNQVPGSFYYTEQKYSGQINRFGDTPTSLEFNLKGSSFTTAEKTAIDQRALNKLYADIKSMKINLGQAYAERSQLAKLFISTVKQTAGAYKDLKKGDLKGALSRLGLSVSKRELKRIGKLKSTASRWLAIQYGIKPLVSDLHGAAEALARARYGPPRGRAYAKDFVGKTIASRTVVPDTSSSKGAEVTLTGSERYDCKYVVYFQDDSPLLTELSALGITNPALIAWEVLPFSFVIDWFIPLGNWISSWDATLGLTFKTGGKTVVRKRNVVKAEYRPRAKAYDNWIYEWRTGKKYELVEVIRTPMSSFPSIPLPRFKDNFYSHAKLANAMALLTVTFRK